MDNLFFIQITDLHLTEDVNASLSEGTKPWHNFEKVLHHLHGLTQYPDFLLITGDIANNQEQAVYLNAANHLSALPFPVYWLGGNHDDVDFMLSKAQSLGIQTEKTFTYQGARLILLNSVEPAGKESYGELSQKELTFLKNTLAQAQEKTCIVALHHPPIRTGSKWMDEIGLRNADALLSILEKHTATKVVLFGHIHSELDKIHQGIRYLACPSTAVQFQISPSFAFDTLPIGYREIRLDSQNQIQTQVIRL